VIPVREVLNCVLRHDGRAFAVAHNHPSGNPTPSESDRRATRDLMAAAKVVGLRLLDHLVIADALWTSAAI
jgi:DNA repair protein RadC